MVYVQASSLDDSLTQGYTFDDDDDAVAIRGVYTVTHVFQFLRSP